MPTDAASAPVRWPSQTVAAMLALLALATGCASDNSIDQTYGRRRGEGAESVNGTGVLAELFRQSGSQVSTWRRLSPRLENCQTLVWTPDTFKPPGAHEREFLTQWLRNSPGRRLVYIGRDFDAASHYWRKAAANAPPEMAAEMLVRQAQAEASYISERERSMPEQQYSPWFTVRLNGSPRQVTRLEGEWAEGVDASKAEIFLGGRLDPPLKAEQSPGEPEPFHSETLLDSDLGPLVLRMQEWQGNDSAVIVVANGSFLLNMPLVNHEHRKLAALLVEECSPGENVIFLESGRAGLHVGKDEQSSPKDFPFWPIGVILLHWMALLLIVLCVHFPIFGRPAKLPPPGRSDFGRHIAALGELLERTNELAHAQSRVQHYHQQVHRESGASHATTTARRRKGRLKITISLPGNVSPAPDDLEHRQKLERLLLRRRLGAVVARGAGPGSMSLTLLVNDLEAAHRKIDAVLRETGMARDARVEEATELPRAASGSEEPSRSGSVYDELSRFNASSDSPGVD